MSGAEYNYGRESAVATCARDYDCAMCGKVVTIFSDHEGCPPMKGNPVFCTDCSDAVILLAGEDRKERARVYVEEHGWPEWAEKYR